MAFDVHETSASGPPGSVQLIDLTEEEPEAPFAVREADGSTAGVPGRIPDKAEVLAWLEDHPVIVGIATGVICFAIIAAALSVVLGSDSGQSDNSSASAALSDADGSQGSFRSSGSGGANFTSDDSKLSRSGAGKVIDGSDDGEAAAGATRDPSGPTTGQSPTTSPATGATPNLDQNATVNDGTNGPQTDTGTGTGTGRGTGQNSTPTTAGSTVSTLNPGPNVSGPRPTTPTTTGTSNPGTNPTTPTTRQTTSTSPATTPTSGVTTTTASTTTTTSTTAPPPPVALSIAAPGNGTSHSFESPVNFAANFIPGATQYCWSFVQSGQTASAVGGCSSATTYQLSARPNGIEPGLVTATVVATGSFGTLNDSVQFSLVRTRGVLVTPNRDLQIGRSPLVIRAADMVGAAEFCFRITQTGYDSGEFCGPDTGRNYNKNDPIWDSLSPGSLTVSAKVKSSSGLLLASGSTTIQLLAP